MKILFLCSGNQVRSQMGEGWARELCDDRHEITSAGLQAGGVHPRAVETMRLAGVDISQHGTRRVSDELFKWADCIITMSDAIEQYSPYFPKTAIHQHWPVANPDAMLDVNIDKAYAIVRDDIRLRVEKLLTEISNSQ